MSQKNGSSGGKPDVDALRDEIRQTRAELGETVSALAAKADVKARAKDQVELAKQKVKAQAAETTGKVTDKVREVAAAATGAAVAATGAVRHTADRAGEKVAGSGALDRAYVAREQVRRNPVPLAAVLVAGAAVVGLILILRGRRR
jgi:cobalamin biosynthesis Mg chelatase CobN